MKNILFIGGIATAAVLAAGSAFAQSPGYGAIGPGMMQHHMTRGMGPSMGSEMHSQMRQGMDGHKGPGMQGRMGPRRWGWA